MYQRRLPNDLQQILAALAPHREELGGVVIESTFNWYWLVDGLMEAGYRVHLANTTAIKKYEGLKYSGDTADALYLAQLLRLELLPEGYIYPREERAARDLSREAHATGALPDGADSLDREHHGAADRRADEQQRDQRALACTGRCAGLATGRDAGTQG